MSILDRQPIFELRLQSFGTSFFLEMNGISMLKEYDDFAQIETTVPVNQWVRSGRNILGLYVLPKEEGARINPSSHVNAELWVREVSGSKNEFKLASISMKGEMVTEGRSAETGTPSGSFDSHRGFMAAEEGDLIVEDTTVRDVLDYRGGLILERAITVSCPLPEWAFFNSDELPDYDSAPDDQYYLARDELFVEYMKIQDALAKGNIDFIVSTIAERNREADTAFYLEPGTTEKKIRFSLTDAIKDNNLELAELLPDYVGIRVEDNRKLVRLVRSGDTAAIGFDFKSFPGSQSYDFIFRRENGNWIVTR